MASDAKTEALMVETRKRAGLIDRYVDLIPARFYMSSEVLQAHKPRNSLDPREYKPTSQLLVEVLTASAGSAGSSSQGGKKNKKKKQGAQPQAAPNSPASREDLRQLLEKRIAELKEERRKKQSATDKEKHAAKAKATAAEAGNGKRTLEDAAPEAKRQRKEAVDEDDVETGRLNFQPKVGDLPFEASVNRRGAKMRQLRSTLRKEEAKHRKMDGAQDKGEREALREQFALDAALRRARGEKVHDDVSRLRKAQKQLEMRKLKGKEKWDSRIEAAKKEAEDKQNKKKENLKNRKGKKKGGKGRAGFEGKSTGYLNSGED